MVRKLKRKLIRFLRWSENYTQTDMVYLAKGGFWQILCKVVTFLIGFATLSALSRWLSKETFGAYQYVLSIISILGLATLPAMGAALTRAVARGKEGMLAEVAKEKGKWSALGILVCLGCGFWYLGQGNPTLGFSFLMASFFFPFPRIFNMYTPFWQGRKRFDKDAKYTMGINFFEAVLFIPAIYFFNSLLLILVAYFVSRSIFRGLAFYFTYRNVAHCKKDRVTLSYGKHLTAMQAINVFANHLDKIIIWQFLGPVQVAIYAFAKLPVTKLKSAVPVSTLSLPKLSAKKVKHIKPQLLGKFYKLFGLGAAMFVGFYFVAPYVYKIAFPHYLDSVAYARGLSVLFVLIPFVLLDTALVSEIKKRELYIVRIVAPGVKIVLFACLIPFYGVWGIVIAIVASEAVKGGLEYYYFVKI